MTSFNPSLLRSSDSNDGNNSSQPTQNNRVDHTIPNLVKGILKKTRQAEKTTLNHPIFLTSLTPLNHTTFKSFLEDFYKAKGFNNNEINKFFTVDESDCLSILGKHLNSKQLEVLEREIFYLKTAWDLKSPEPLNLLKESFPFTENGTSRHIRFELDPSIVEENKPRPKACRHQEAEPESMIFNLGSMNVVGLLTRQVREENDLKQEQVFLKFLANLLNGNEDDKAYYLGKILDRLDPESADEFAEYVFVLRARAIRQLSEDELTYLKNVYKFSRLYGTKLTNKSTTQSL